jgi:hypothetical protein
LVRIDIGVDCSARGSDDSRHQAVAAFGPLIGVGVRAQGDMVTRPLRAYQFGGEDFGDIDLDDDLAIEVGPGVEIEVAVGVPCEAVHAGVRAAAVGVDRPGKRHRTGPRDAVESGLRQYLVEGDS